MIDREIIRKLLEIELHNFSNRLGLINKESKQIPYNLLLQAINTLKKISNSVEDDFGKQLAIMLVAIIWTHSKKEIHDNLRQIITPVLASLGFSPSNLMLDEELRNGGIYSPLASYFDKLRIATYDLKNQIVITDTPYTLTSFQANLWRTINEGKVIGVSAPTSAGKSFLIYLKIIDMISKGERRIVYVVPTLSLISQVTADLTRLLRKHRLNDIEVLNSFEDDLENFIYVVTQERAIVLFSENGVDALDLLVVDEVQNLEKVANEGEERPKILYDVLIDVRNDIEVNKIIISGPRLRNIGNLGFRVFGEMSREETTDAPPVLSLTYSISKKKSKYYLNLYSAILDEPIQLAIENSEHIQGLGQVKYTDKFNNYLYKILTKLSQETNIVFSPTSRQARKSAGLYATQNQLPLSKNINKCIELGKYLRETVHPQYELASMVEKGIAYHTGKTPMHARKSIEYATSNSWVRTLFCTTTLMQGVNLPANNVIIRNPNLFTKKTTGVEPSLSAYEFANLRGRAGRLLTDFIGRTIVLDEDSFSIAESKDDRNSLFPDEYKEIKTGYQEIYTNNLREVNSALADENWINDFASKGLVTYIRQVLYRHGTNGEARLRNVGLYLDKQLLNNTLSQLKKLRIRREIVLANRYWDPIDLNKLHFIHLNSNNKFPTNIFVRDLYKYLLDWSLTLQEYFPYYFNRYLKEGINEKYLYGITKSAESWAREVPLVQILIGRFGYDEIELDDQIDAEIEKLTKYVSFGLPMLLKPLSEMQGKNTSIISAIELGLYSPISKYLSDRGVPRETAIKISSLQKNLPINKVDWNLVKRNLNQWELQHIEHLL